MANLACEVPSLHTLQRISSTAHQRQLQTVCKQGGLESKVLSLAHLFRHFGVDTGEMTLV